MRFRIGFVLGAAAGFYAGAKAGQPVLDRISAVTGGQGRAGQAEPAASPTFVRTTDRAGAGPGVEDERATNDQIEAEAVPDIAPSDVQFGQAAARKEELVDEAMAADELDELLDEGAAPRAGNKAPPVTA